MSESVFISYPSESFAQVELLADFLQKNGVDAIWIDRKTISAGENIGDKIRDGIRASFCCVFVLNKYSCDAAWCIAEVGAFWGADKPIIVHRGIEPRCDPPDYLRDICYAEDHHAVLDGIETARSRPETIPIDEADVFPGDPTLRAFQRAGLKHAFRITDMDSQRENRVRELVKEECKLENPAFRLAASSGFNYIHAQGKVWELGLGDAVMSGKAKFDVVLASPFSVFAVTRALANDVIYEHWEQRGIPAELRKFTDQDNVSISVTGFPVNCSLFFTSSSVFYDPYLWGHPARRRTENNFWVFEFENRGDPKYACYELLEKHFSFLKGERESGADMQAVKPIPIAEFMGENNERYERLRRTFQAKIQRIGEGEDYDPTVAF